MTVAHMSARKIAEYFDVFVVNELRPSYTRLEVR
jgi:hypothetical protein